MVDSGSAPIDQRFRTFKGRLEYALWVRQGVTGEKPPSQAQLGEMVGKAGGKVSSQTAASGWLSGVMPRDLDTQLALARVVGADPGWLFYGPQHSAAPAPEVPVPNVPPAYATKSGAPSVIGSEAQKAASERRKRLEEGDDKRKPKGA